MRWDAWRDDPDHAGVIVDFDGTLAAIVRHPEQARPLPGALDVLASLAARYAVVAVVSGRPAAFLARAIDVPGVERWGTYGLDRVGPDGGVELDAAAEPWRPQVAAVVRAATAAAPDGVGVEDKGASVTLHFRNAPGHQDWVEGFAAEQAERTGLAVYAARASVELRPPLDVDKGTVVTRLVRERALRAACFVGDDHGDLAAFRALDAVEIGVRVAVRSDEAPPELLDAADVIVDGPDGALDLLRSLVALVS
ncbi:MAG: trehalose-phosphatase [Acidimicrobiales bacterium]